MAGSARDGWPEGVNRLKDRFQCFVLPESNGKEFDEAMKQAIQAFIHRHGYKAPFFFKPGDGIYRLGPIYDVAD